MAHKLISDEMVEKALDAMLMPRPFPANAPAIMRAALEAVADEIRNQVIKECAKKCWDSAPSHHKSCWKGRRYNDEASVRKQVASEIRSLKSQGQ